MSADDKRQRVVQIGGRTVLAIAGVVMIAAAAFVWFSDSQHTLRNKTTTTTVVQRADGDRERPHGDTEPAGLETAEVRKVTGEGAVASSLDANQPLLLGLLALAAALMFCATFFGRITELGLLGLTVKLGPQLAAAVREVNTRVDDPQLAGETVLDFLLRLLQRLSTKHQLDALDVEQAKEGAIEQSMGNVGAAVSVSETDRGLAIAVEEPGPPVRVTSARQLLSRAVFDPDAVAKIDGADDELGRSLYAIDSESGEVLAAASYEIEQPDRQVVIDAFTMHRNAEAGQVRICAQTLLLFVKTIAEKLGGASRVLLRLDAEPSRDELQALGSLGFRPATAEETKAMRPGMYWTFLGPV